MICILHGYLLEGSGSNLWTRSIIQSLCRKGQEVHLVCQENHPEIYDFISEAYRYLPDGKTETILKRTVPYKGLCIMHKPVLGDTLPVYVWDRYEEFKNVVPMKDLPDEEIEAYLKTNVDIITGIVRKFDIKAILANHAVLMSVAAHRVFKETQVPYSIMPHGSAMEYAVEIDKRFQKLALGAFAAAKRIFYIGPDVKERVKHLFGSIPALDEKLVRLNLGVDTSLFKPIDISLRKGSVDKLKEAVKDMPRAVSFDERRTDSDFENKIDTVNWENDKILLFVGRIIENKGLHTIVAALPLILDKYPDARLLVVGHGPMRQAIMDFIEEIKQAKKPTLLPEFFSKLKNKGELESYFDKARQHLQPNTVIFTGYLTHKELKYLFPCCDIGIFPSLSKEAGPLVFLEALASGSFPIGTYFGGMADNIDSAAKVLPEQVIKLMKLSVEKDKVVEDIANNVSGALDLGSKYKQEFNNIAVTNYDWSSVSEKLIRELGV